TRRSSDLLDVVRVVHARVGRILTNGLVGLVDRRFGLAVLVVGVHQVELPLARRVRKRKARFEPLVVDGSVAKIAVVGGALRAFVEKIGIPKLFAGLIA